jgi:hypothetical protein
MEDLGHQQRALLPPVSQPPLPPHLAHPKHLSFRKPHQRPDLSYRAFHLLPLTPPQEGIEIGIGLVEVQPILHLARSKRLPYSPQLVVATHIIECLLLRLQLFFLAVEDAD